MRKKISIILLLSLLLVFTACENEGKNPSTEDTNKEQKNVSSEDKEKSESKDPVAETKKDTEKSTYYDSEGQDEVPEGEELINSYLVEDVDKYIDILNIKNLSTFDGVDLKLLSYEWGQNYTGLVKKYYAIDKKDNAHRIRVPHIKGESEEIDEINKEIISLFDDYEKGLFSYESDFDAIIYEDILSLKISKRVQKDEQVYVPNQIVKTYLFDIKNGELSLLSKNEFLERNNISKELINDFLEHYVIDALEAYNYDGSKEPEDIAKIAIAGFNKSYENDDVDIFISNTYPAFKSKLKYVYEEDGVFYDFEFILEDSDLKMSLLSFPNFKSAVVYNCFGEEQNLDDFSVFGNKIDIIKLNEKTEGTIPVYISTIGRCFDWGEDPEYKEINLKICASHFDFISEDYKNEKIDFMLKKLKTTLEYNTKNAFNVFVYYTTLPESIPNETILLNFSEVDIYDDMRYGSPVHYIEEMLLSPELYASIDEETYMLKLNKDHSFSTEYELYDEIKDWSALGLNITGGSYNRIESSDNYYLVLFPCQDDLNNGASEYYVFKETEYDGIKLIYGADEGILDEKIDLTMGVGL